MASTISRAEQDNPAAPAGADPKQLANLYVGNLSHRVDENMLKEIFLTAGSIKNVKIIHDRNQTFQGVNYGFVEFDDPAAANLALTTLNGRRIFDQDIRVNWAYQGGSQQKEDTTSTNHYHIFVGDLSSEVNDEELGRHFAKFPSLSEARVMWDTSTGRSRGYGFVAFRERHDAEQVLGSMQGEYISGRQIRVNWANQKNKLPAQQQMPQMGGMMYPQGPAATGETMPQMPGPQANMQNYTFIYNQAPPFNCTVYVGNITQFTTQNDLIPHFQQFGYISEIRMQADRGFAFVKYENHEQATAAICALNATWIHGRAIKLSWGKERPPNGAQPMYPPAAQQAGFYQNPYQQGGYGREDSSALAAGYPQQYTAYQQQAAQQMYYGGGPQAPGRKA